MKKLAATVLAVLCVFAAIGNPFGTQTAFVASAAAKQNPALAEAQANVKAAIEAMTITSHTTAEDILAVASAVTDMQVSVGKPSISFPATKTEPGRATVRVKIGMNANNSVIFTMNVRIAPEMGYSDANRVAMASDAIVAYMRDFTATNDTTLADIIAAARNAITDGDITIDEENSKVTMMVKATDEASGNISVSLCVRCNGEYFMCNFGRPIAEVYTGNKKLLDEDWRSVSSAMHAVVEQYGNSTTQEQLIEAGKAAAKNGSTVEWQNGVTKKIATFDEDGQILGYVNVTLNGETKELRFHEKLDKLYRKIPTEISVSRDEWDILRFTNVERFKLGKTIYSTTKIMQDTCDVRKKELIELYSHTRPNGEKCFTAFPSDFKYTTAGENIQSCAEGGYILPQAAVDNWMNSPGHYANIMNDSFQFMGVGYTRHKMLQMFATTGSSVVSVTTSTGSMSFANDDEMQKAYFILTHQDGTTSYAPIDVNSMTKNGNSYTASFKKCETPVVLTVGQTITEDAPRFMDVPADAYYAVPVAWAVDKKITSGTSLTTFSPANTCTRAHILTFLWRAVGSPKDSSGNHFNDVCSDDYFYNAALWAYDMGMVEGESFEGDLACTRAATVTYLWQCAGSPEPDGQCAFDDVPADAPYAEAVAWAVENGITTGTSATTFSPNMVCDRGQIVTFLHRALK